MTTEKIPLESIAREPILDRPTPSGSDLISGKSSDRIQNQIQVLELEQSRKNCTDRASQIKDLQEQYEQALQKEKEAEEEACRQEAKERKAEEKKAEEKIRQQEVTAENAKKTIQQARQTPQTQQKNISSNLGKI